MPSFSVRFKGMLTNYERERFAAANITVAGKQPAMRTGIIKTGRPIYTVTLEADSPEDALAKVRAALEPDTGNFSNWESGPTDA